MRLSSTGLLVLVALSGACAATDAVPPRSSAPPASAVPRSPPVAASPVAPPPATPETPPAVVTGTQQTKNPPHPFPPPDLTPPSARSAVDGDGHWKPFGAARAADGAPFVVTTTLHPLSGSKLVTLTLVAIDRTRAELGFLPGVADVAKLTVPFVPGLVPEAERPRLLAVFNGGFLPRHGRWGMRVGAVTVMPPRDIGCTVLLLTNGDVRLGTWSSVAVPDGELRALRQTPPCLVEGGAVHPDLLRNRDRAWGGQTPGLVTRRRSALGLSADGRVLFYAIGVETSPKLLAQGLAMAGAHVAAQLDINWNWTRFFAVAPDPNGRLGLTEPLVSVEYNQRDYVEHPSERDFFYVLRRGP